MLDYGRRRFGLGGRCEAKRQVHLDDGSIGGWHELQPLPVAIQVPQASSNVAQPDTASAVRAARVAHARPRNVKPIAGAVVRRISAVDDAQAQGGLFHPRDNLDAARPSPVRQAVTDGVFEQRLQ